MLVSGQREADHTGEIVGNSEAAPRLVNCPALTQKRPLVSQKDGLAPPRGGMAKRTRESTTGNSGSRICVVSTSRDYGRAGRACFDESHPYIYPGICCLQCWPIGFKRTSWETSRLMPYGCWKNLQTATQRLGSCN